MALSINDIYNYVYSLGNKQQSGEWSDTAFNSACAFVSLDIFRKETGIPEDYTPNNPIPRVAWQLTNTISDDLRLLVKRVTIPKVNGYFPFPSDYGIFSSMYYRFIQNTPNGNPTVEKSWIETVTDDEKRVREMSKIKPPTLFYPIASYYMQGFDVLPESIDKIELTYLKIPATPVRNFIQLTNDQTEYDPIGSVQFEYPETLYPNIAARIAMQLGISIREEQFVAYMNQRKQEGN